MSFILEALKKSEEQRQQQNASPQKVRKRTLSLQASHARRPYWLLAFPVLVLLGSGIWWIYNGMEEPSGGMAATADLATVEPPATVEPIVAPTAVMTAPEPPPVAAKPVVMAEPAPVPYASYVESKPLPRVETKASADASASRVRNTGSPEQPVADAKLSPATGAEPRVAFLSREEPVLPPVADLPTYQELSRELRERLPRLAMSMHFYNSDPNRRLVRINDQLLREGSWVAKDLQIVEITPTGVSLDYLGTGFELRGSER